MVLGFMAGKSLYVSLFANQWRYVFASFDCSQPGIDVHNIDGCDMHACNQCMVTLVFLTPLCKNSCKKFVERFFIGLSMELSNLYCFL